MATTEVFADTNLFLRYLTNDVPKQAAAVQRLIEQARDGEVILRVTPLVIAEIVWTLSSFYKLSKTSIQYLVLVVLNSPGVVVDDAPIVAEATMLFANLNIDFIDAYHICWMPTAGLGTVYTFDVKHFRRDNRINVVQPL